MCGIVGVIKKKGASITPREFVDFQILLDCAEARGSDATGVIYIYENGEIVCMKSPSKSIKVTDFLPYRENLRAILGHTRASTGGSPSDNKNNHPHYTKNWALIHNGVCSNSIDRKDLDLETSCDTEEFVATFELTAETTLDLTEEKIITKSLNHMSGSWSLAFVNKQSANIYLTTNGRSPLDVISVKDGLYFASSEKYFESTSIKNKIEALTTTLGFKPKLKKNVLQIKQYNSFSPENMVLLLVDDNANLVEKGRYEPASFQKDYSNYRSYGYYNGYDDDQMYGYGKHGYGQYDNTYEKKYNTSTKKTTKPAVVLGPNKRNETKEEKENRKINEKFSELEGALAASVIEFDIDTWNYCNPMEDEATRKEQARLALWILKNDAETFNYTQKYGKSLFSKQYKHGWDSPPKALNTRLRKMATETFISELFNFIDKNFTKDSIPVSLWNLITIEDEIEERIISSFDWFELVYIIKYGLLFIGDTIDNIDVDLEKYMTKTEALDNIDNLEISNFECGSCGIERRMFISGDNEITHICGLCHSQLRECTETGSCFINY